MKNIKELLPIGSVVLLKGGTKKTIIMGILQALPENKDQVYDYLGVPYPEGYMGTKATYVFNHEDINDVIFEGYQNPEREGLLMLLQSVYDRAAERVAQENTGEKEE